MTLPSAVFQATPEDFIVEELDAYAASGTGGHLFVRIRKRGLTTEQAIARICEALSVDRRAAGFAGQKDRVAIATQRISLPGVTAQAALDLAGRWDDLDILDAIPHGQKLKPGHLRGNRFIVTLRGIDPSALASVEASLDRVFAEGLANAFGHQRFGRDGDNAERALSFVRGESRPPGDPRLRRMLFSALQSRWFNRVLAARVKDGTWNVPQRGDLLKKHTSGGMFLCEDEATDRARALAGELSPTGPIFGAKMQAPGEPIASFERAVLAEDGIDDSHLRANKSLGEGTRRPLRVWIEDGSHGRADEAPSSELPAASLVVALTLPKGVYASTALAQAVTLTRADRPDPRTSPERSSADAESSEADADANETDGEA